MGRTVLRICVQTAESKHCRERRKRSGHGRVCARHRPDRDGGGSRDERLRHYDRQRTDVNRRQIDWFHQLTALGGRTEQSRQPLLRLMLVRRESGRPVGSGVSRTLRNLFSREHLKKESNRYVD